MGKLFYLIAKLFGKNVNMLGLSKLKEMIKNRVAPTWLILLCALLVLVSLVVVPLFDMDPSTNISYLEIGTLISLIIPLIFSRKREDQDNGGDKQTDS
jgi:uncharacterized membrane protein YhaH (DUF805 family)